MQFTNPISIYFLFQTTDISFPWVVPTINYTLLTWPLSTINTIIPSTGTEAISSIRHICRYHNTRFIWFLRNQNGNDFPPFEISTINLWVTLPPVDLFGRPPHSRCHLAGEGWESGKPFAFNDWWNSLSDIAHTTRCARQAVQHL